MKAHPAAKMPWACNWIFKTVIGYYDLTFLISVVLSLVVVVVVVVGVFFLGANMNSAVFMGYSRT